MSQGIKERVINFLRGKFKIVVFDEVAMLQRRVYRFTGLKIVTLIGGAVLLVFILAVVLATQTGILRVLGPRPAMLLGQDYIGLSKEIDSLQRLYKESEEKFANIEEILTRQISTASNAQKKVEFSPFEMNEEVQVVEDKLPLLHFETPVEGEITSSFSLDKMHYGIDLAAKSNSPVRAAAGGIVFLNGYSRDDGYVVMIQHPNGYSSWYKHNSRNLVVTGQEVYKGEEIAIIGNTGENSSGPHLHFELWKDDKPLNPEDLIPLKAN